jgi:hypothetical protein
VATLISLPITPAGVLSNAGLTKALHSITATHCITGMA